MTEGDTWKWVRVSTELLAELEEWSDPVRVRISSETDGVLEMEFRREVIADTTSS